MRRSARRTSGTGRGVRRRGRRAAADRPMPRWSKTIRSRVAAIGPSSSANSSANGSAGCPGPPASAMIALRASPTRRAVAADGERDRARRRRRWGPAARSGGRRRSRCCRAHGANAIWAARRAEPPGAQIQAQRPRSTAASSRAGGSHPAESISRRRGACAATAGRGARALGSARWRASARPSTHPARRAAIGPYSHARARGRAAVLLGADPARSRQRGARRRGRRPSRRGAAWRTCRRCARRPAPTLERARAR